MKKSTTAFMIIVLGLGAYFFYQAELGPDVVRRFFSGDKKIIKQMSLSFMEDIKFKDFQKAATYHHPDDQKKVNIPSLIERLFKIKPEFLDMMEYDILEASLDSSGKRARVKLKAKVHILNSDKIKKPEFILYFHQKEEAWYMELESSLH